MEIQTTESNCAVISVTRDEVALIGNCLNEVCNALSWDFQTRTGYEIQEARDVLKQINALHKLMKTR